MHILYTRSHSLSIAMLVTKKERRQQNWYFLAFLLSVFACESISHATEKVKWWTICCRCFRFVMVFFFFLRFGFHCFISTGTELALFLFQVYLFVRLNSFCFCFRWLYRCDSLFVAYQSDVQDCVVVHTVRFSLNSKWTIVIISHNYGAVMYFTIIAFNLSYIELYAMNVQNECM